MQRTAEVRHYFRERAQLFDTLYADDDKLAATFNKVFRRPMFLRYVKTLEALGDLKGKTVLDVGCGSGRYAVELARRGARVVGVDFSEDMLKLAEALAVEAKVADSCEFVCADFTSWATSTDHHFDAAIAMGVLDYVQDAPPFVSLMAKLSDEVVISFPRPTPVRMPLRKLRYWLRGCPVHFYSKREIREIYHQAGLSTLRVERLGFAGYWVSGQR